MRGDEERESKNSHSIRDTKVRFIYLCLVHNGYRFYSSKLSSSISSTCVNVPSALMFAMEPPSS